MYNSYNTNTEKRFLPNREVLFHQEAKNESEDYIPAPWVPTFEVQTTASHTFTLKELKNKEDVVVRGCEFMVNPIEPIHFDVEGCPTLYTGEVVLSFCDLFQGIIT